MPHNDDRRFFAIEQGHRTTIETANLLIDACELVAGASPPQVRISLSASIEEINLIYAG
jgi:hypothetical protein